MGYVIAAYVVVLGSLLVYGLRVQAQRRALSRSSDDVSPGESPRP